MNKKRTSTNNEFLKNKLLKKNKNSKKNKVSKKKNKVSKKKNKISKKKKNKNKFIKGGGTNMSSGAKNYKCSCRLIKSIDNTTNISTAKNIDMDHLELGMLIYHTPGDIYLLLDIKPIQHTQGNPLYLVILLTTKSFKQIPINDYKVLTIDNYKKMGNKPEVPTYEEFKSIMEETDNPEKARIINEHEEQLKKIFEHLRSTQ